MDPTNADATQIKPRVQRISPTQAAVALIVATFIARCIIAATFGLGNGEAYHYSCALRPSLSYFDHPPLSLLLATLSMKLTGGNGPLVVRFPTILLFAGTTWLVFLLGRRFFSDRAGFWAAVLLNVSAVFTFSTGLFLQPDGPLMFFWMVCVYCLSRLFFDEPVKRPYLWWLGVGVSLGLAMLAKYHAVFLIFGAGMFALTSSRHRRWVLHPGPYLAMVVAAVFFSPVLLWNHQHDWISFLWQGNRGLDSKGLRLDWLFRNIGGQALWILPWIWAPLLWELPKSFSKGRTSDAYWFVAWLAVAPIMLFTIVSAYAPIGFHFHWQAPGYLLLFLPLGATVATKVAEDHLWTRRWLRFSTVATVGLILMFTTHGATGWWREVGPQWLANRMGVDVDPTLEALDFASIRQGLKDRGLYRKNDTFVFTSRWFQSGKVDYALRGEMPVLCLNPWDQRSWAFMESTERWVGKDGVLIEHKRFLDDPNWMFGEFFERIEPMGTIDVRRGRHVEMVLHVYYCRGLKEPYPNPYLPKPSLAAVAGRESRGATR